MIRWIFLLGLVCNARGISVKFADCGDIHTYNVEEVILDVKCSTEPCPLPLRTYTNTTIAFRSTSVTANDLTAKAFFTVSNRNETISVAPISCPVHVCPIAANEHKKFSLLLMPKFIGPNYAVNIHVKLYNQSNTEVVCARFMALICNPAKNIQCKPKNF